MARILDVYSRVSHKSDKEVLSTAGQEARCLDRVTRVGAELGRVFTDPERSAWNPKVRRPGFDALMARLECGESDGVVVFDLARFARRMVDGERLIIAAERGLAILDSGSEYDLTTASGKENFRHKMVGAAAYSDMVSESSRRGKEYKAHSGQVDCRRSFGFEPDGVTVRADEAAVIRDHAARLLAGETQDSLINELNGGGTPSVRGARWGYTTYRQIMTRPRNAGLIVHNGKVVEGVRLPFSILDDDIHHRLVALYAARRPGRPPSGRYMLTALAFCGLCGSGLAGRPVSGSARKQYWCRKCRRIFVDADRLDTWAGDYAMRVLSDPKHASMVERAQRESLEARAALEAEAVGIESTLIEIGARLGRGELSLARHDAICGPLDKRLGQLRAGLDDLAVADVDGGYSPVLTSREVEQLTFLERWDAGDAVERRGMVKAALRGRRIVVSPGRSARFSPERCEVL